MYPLNDNDLDRLSREAADQYDVEPRTSGWEALEHRLNKELPPKEDKERRRFLFWLFLIVLLAGGGVLWTMSNSNRPGRVHLTGANTVPVADKAEQATTDNEAVTNNNEIPGTTAQAAREHGERSDAVADKKDNTTDKYTSQQQHDQVTNQPADNKRIDKDAAQQAPGKTIQQLPANQHTGKITDRYAANNPVNKSVLQRATNKQVDKATHQPAANQPTIAAARSTSIQPGNKINTATVQDQMSTSATHAGYKDPAPSLVQDPNPLAGKRGDIKAPVLTLATENKTENKQAPAPLKRISQPGGLEIGLLAGPDMSNVRFTDVDKVGYNVGLQVAYRFNNRWSVNTGVVFTRKNYTAQGKDFTKPAGNYWDNADVRKIAGDCVMFDIPLNVRYDLSIGKKTRWFASAGVSSYIMTNQNYTVDYLYNGMPRMYPHEDYGTSTYLFSIVNLSAGFETKLNRRLSLQAEPYFKLPTKGLGYGKLDLNSYGLYFSLRYQLHK